MPPNIVPVFVEKLTIVNNPNFPYALCGQAYRVGDVIYRATITYGCLDVALSDKVLGDVIKRAIDYVAEHDSSSVVSLTYSRELATANDCQVVAEIIREMGNPNNIITTDLIDRLNKIITALRTA